MNFKVKINDFFFFIAYIIFLAYKILSVSTFSEIIGENVVNYIKISSWALFTIKILVCNKFNIKSIMTYSILVLLAIIIRIKSGSSEILELILVIISANGIEFKKIAKVTLVETSIFCIIIVISSLIGIIPNYEFKRSNGKYSKAFGFIYVSKLSSFILNILFLKIYLDYSENKNITVSKLFLYFSLCTIGFLLTYVRNQYILSVILIISYIYLSRHKKIKLKKYKMELVCVVPICAFIILFMIANFDNTISWHNKLDNILNTRLSVMNRVYKQSKITAFGNNIEMKGFNMVNENYTFVDSGFVAVWLRDGYVGLGMICFAYMYMLKKYIEEHNYIMAIWILLVAISAMIDDTLLIQLNFNCIILSLLNFKSKEPVKEEKNESSSSNSYI